MSELHEDLERALRTVPVGEPPVEAVRRAGRRIRGRRRAGLAAGVLAVVTAAVAIPVLAGTTAAAPPPVIGHRAHDPALTDGPGGKTTQGAKGLVSADGVIATGTIGHVRWQVTVHGPGLASPVPSEPCTLVRFSGVSAKQSCAPLPPEQVSSGRPAALNRLNVGPGMTFIGQTAPDVAYFLVNFADGQRLKLIPVAVRGYRYIAWSAPASMTVMSVVAHLGGPYSDSGQTLTAVPLNLPGQMPFFGLWQRPGQAVPPRASVVLARGTAPRLNGRAGSFAWSLSAREGPWGTCFVFSSSATMDPGGVDCDASGQLATTGILSIQGLVKAVPVYSGSVAPGVVSVRLSVSNGKTVTVTPVKVGNERLFAAALSEGTMADSWAAYDASGKQVASGKLSS